MDCAARACAVHFAHIRGHSHHIAPVAGSWPSPESIAGKAGVLGQACGVNEVEQEACRVPLTTDTDTFTRYPGVAPLM